MIVDNHEGNSKTNLNGVKIIPWFGPIIFRREGARPLPRQIKTERYAVVTPVNPNCMMVEAGHRPYKDLTSYERSQKTRQQR